MRSLFAKILLWFWGALTVTAIGSALISYSLAGRRFPMDAVLDLELQQAREAYEKGGRAQLAAFLDRLQAAYHGRAFLTDSSGRDLLTGQSRSILLDRAERGNSPLDLFRTGPGALVRSTGDGRYQLVFVAALRPRGGSWFLLPEHWWVIAAGVVLCYWLAFHFTRPVRRMQHAVERFGAGDLGARVNSSRRDELGQLARSIDRMADRIQILLAAERRLLLDISHELRSPLARLGVAVELARTGENRDAALDRIERESVRLNALVGELLQVTRAEGDPGSLRAESVRLDLLLQEIAGDCVIEARARGSAIVPGAAEACTVEGDPELLRRAIENVLRNAIRYAPAGTSVELDLERRDRTAVVRVRDYGPGVPVEALPHIFDAFYRVESDRGRASGGVGLGLSIARRAVELHKGRILARNADPGLEVSLELPRGAPGGSPAAG